MGIYILFTKDSNSEAYCFVKFDAYKYTDTYILT